ncbi:hypothetical protein HY628_00740, partial [Candidatus Uhrbacteria bacterium]|nr:hypothetical protein [Candidatus Uhrbacteria bacterium]
MKFIFRFIPILLALLTLGLFGAIAAVPSKTLLLFPFYALLLGLGVRELMGRRLRERDFWSATITILFLTASGIVFFLFLEEEIALVAVALLVSGCLALFFEQLYRWFYTQEALPSSTLGISYALLELLTVFFTASAFLGFRTLLQ